jgi:hypothetical protein
LLMSIFPQTTSDVPQYLVTPRSEFGEGSPIVTTTDGRSNPIVWIIGAEGDERLHGYRGDTGEPIRQVRFGSTRNKLVSLADDFDRLAAQSAKIGANRHRISVESGM